MEMATFDALRPVFQGLVLAVIVASLIVRYLQCAREQDESVEEEGIAATHHGKRPKSPARPEG